MDLKYLLNFEKGDRLKVTYHDGSERTCYMVGIDEENPGLVYRTKQLRSRPNTGDVPFTHRHLTTPIEEISTIERRPEE